MRPRVSAQPRDGTFTALMSCQPARRVAASDQDRYKKQQLRMFTAGIRENDVIFCSYTVKLDGGQYSGRSV